MRIVASPLLHRRIVHVLEQHRDAGVGVGHGDAAAHGAGADHRGARDRRHRRVFRHVGHLRGFAIGEEHVHQRARLVRGDAVGEQLALARGAALEIERERPLDGIDGLERRLDASAPSSRARFARPRRRPHRPRDRRSSPNARASCGLAPAFDLRKRDRIVEQVRARDLIDDAGRQRLRGGHGLAGRAHLDRQLRAAQARQPLRAAGAGNDAEQHFRLADFGVGRHHAVVAGHGDFEAAAERVAVDRGHERLGRVLDAHEPRVRAFGSRQRLLARFQRAEDLDVGARDERRAGADQDDRIDAGVGASARDCGFDAFEHARARAR